jgi:polysaccharide export outer membrane protein
MGVDVSTFAGPIIPVIYNVNFRDPSGYFLATHMEMRNKDVLYISNAVAVEATKAMNFFRTIMATVNDPINTATNIYTLRNLARGSTSTTTIVNTSPPVGP